MKGPKSCWMCVLATVAVVGMWAGLAVAQQVQIIQSGGGQAVRRSYFAIPGLYMLGAEHVRKELELVEEQEKKLRKISEEYQKKLRESWAGMRDLSAEERRTKMTEIREKTKKLADEARKAAEEILLPHQLERLKKLHFRSRARYSLANPRIQEEIELDEGQRERLGKLREELQERMRKLQEEILDKTLDVLTPEQRKKLEETTQQGFTYGYWSGGTRKEKDKAKEKAK